MRSLEKHFVNATDHSRRVAALAERRLRLVPLGVSPTYLDVGCGNGAATRHVAAVFDLDATGVDVDADQIRLAVTTAGTSTRIRFLVGNATHLPFDDGEFDVVASNKTTHHIPQWRAAITEMVRVLRPGGYLIYGDLVLPRWLALIGRSVASRVAGFVTRSELEGIVRAHGLDIVHASGRAGSLELVCRRAESPTGNKRRG